MVFSCGARCVFVDVVADVQHVPSVSSIASTPQSAAVACEHAQRAGHDVPPWVSEPDDCGFQRAHSVHVHGVSDLPFGLVFEQDSKVVVDVDAWTRGPDKRQKVSPFVCFFVFTPYRKVSGWFFLQYSPRRRFALFQSAQP